MNSKYFSSMFLLTRLKLRGTTILKKQRHFNPWKFPNWNFKRHCFIDYRDVQNIVLFKKLLAFDKISGAAVTVTASFLATRLALTPIKVQHMTHEHDDHTFEPDDPRLKTSECLKNAALLSVDASLAALSQAVYAIVAVEKQYQELVKLMTACSEATVEVLGQKEKEEKVADLTLETRQQLNAVKSRKQDLELLFASTERMVDAAAEMAFATGSEYASTNAGEQLYKAQQELKRIKKKSSELETGLNLMEVKMIEAVSRYEEEESKKEGAERVSEDQIQKELEKLQRLDIHKFEQGEVDNSVDKEFERINFNENKQKVDTHESVQKQDGDSNIVSNDKKNKGQKEEEDCKPIDSNKEKEYVFAEDDTVSKEDQYVFVDDFSNYKKKT